MRGNNFFHKVIPFLALAAQSVGAATVTGPAIVEPWKKGRQLALFVIGGAISATAASVCKIEGLRRDDGTTWEALKESDGSTDLGFTASKFNNNGQAENGVILGTIPLDRIDGDTYSALRVSFTQATGAQTVLLGIGALIFDLFDHPSGTSDDLFSKITGQ